MGCTWMNSKEARQAIPPAYTEFIGRDLISYLTTTEIHPMIDGTEGNAA